MTIENMSLNKLLKLLSLNERKLTTALRTDIRADIQKEEGADGGGGDFYGPFWADAKLFVDGKIDLYEATEARIASNPRRADLYRRLYTGFNTWWLERRRWSNRDFSFVPNSVKGNIPLLDGQLDIRVGGLMALNIGGDTHRLIYPYFCKDASLDERVARTGLWVMEQALSKFPVEDMRILDVQRARSFAVRDYPFEGNEEQLLRIEFSRIHKRWQELRQKYPPYAA